MLLRNTALEILEQLKNLLLQIKQEEYATALPVINGSSIGQHVRHTLEFFHCLHEALPSGMVNYDTRKRNTEIESDPHIALRAISTIADQLARSENENPTLTLKAIYGEVPEYVEVPTNYERELAYNIEHAIHHMAIIKIGVTHVNPSLNLPTSFGVAGSTLRHKNQLVNN